MAITDDISDLSDYIENITSTFDKSMSKIQSLAYDIVRSAILDFEIIDSNIWVDDLSKRLVAVDRNLKSMFGSSAYGVAVTEFLDDLTEINKRTVDFHKKWNDLKKETKLLPEARKVIYEQAKTSFNSNSIAAGYIQPIKNLLARQAISGMTIKESLSLIDKWNKGELSSGRLSKGVEVPNLNRYASQIARDTAYSMNRTANDIISKELDLNGFRYTGALVEGSRDLCKHLIGLRRAIKFEELPPLIASYPQGLYPGTNSNNFLQTCGGYNCRHIGLGVHIDD